MTARLDFAQLELHFVDQMQWRYELIRPLVLLAEGTPTQRAVETHTHPDTVRTFTRRFRAQGRFETRMGHFPIRLARHPDAGLLGAAAAFQELYQCQELDQ